MNCPKCKQPVGDSEYCGRCGFGPIRLPETEGKSPAVVAEPVAEAPPLPDRKIRIKRRDDAEKEAAAPEPVAPAKEAAKPQKEPEPAPAKEPEVPPDAGRSQPKPAAESPAARQDIPPVKEVSSAPPEEPPRKDDPPPEEKESSREPRFNTEQVKKAA